MKPSVIKKLGLTYDTLRKHNDRIVCVAITGFGLDGGDYPAFDYVIQAATGVAAMTGDPDDPPTLPGYSSVDNSTALTAALGLLAMIVSGDGGQVDVSLRDVMLSQLNYKASAYLNDGVPRADIRSGRTRSTFRRNCFRPPTGTWHSSSPMTASGGRSPPRPVSRASRPWRNGRRAATRCWPW